MPTRNWRTGPSPKMYFSRGVNYNKHQADQAGKSMLNHNIHILASGPAWKTCAITAIFWLKTGRQPVALVVHVAVSGFIFFARRRKEEQIMNAHAIFINPSHWLDGQGCRDATVWAKRKQTIHQTCRSTGHDAWSLLFRDRQLCCEPIGLVWIQRIELDST